MNSGQEKKIKQLFCTKFYLIINVVYIIFYVNFSNIETKQTEKQIRYDWKEIGLVQKANILYFLLKTINSKGKLENLRNELIVVQ